MRFPTFDEVTMIALSTVLGVFIGTMIVRYWDDIRYFLQ